MLGAQAQEDFRGFLRADLMARCRRNPRYSLRSYSRALGVQSSFLSKLLSGKRSVTPRTVQRFAEGLGLSPRQIARFSGVEPLTPPAMGHLVPLSEDAFQCIAEWYHFAILELFTTKGFKPTAAYLSRRLGISRIVASDALSRLHRLGLVARGSRGSYTLRQGENTTTGLGGTSSALKRVQRKVLEMAIEALEGTPMDQRDQSTMTMAIDASLLPEAKERIKKFRRELCEFLQKNRVTDSVYHLTVSLYPVTRSEPSEEKKS